MKIYFIVLVALVSFAVSADITLVRDGKPQAVIVLEKKPTVSAQLGAYELQHHIKLMTGAILPIVTGNDIPSGKIKICIGGFNSSMAVRERNIIKFSKDRILMTGCDTTEKRKIDYANERTFSEYWLGFYNGPLYATYDFLEEYCGVRFYFMDESGTVYDKRPTLKVMERNRDFLPPLDAFRQIYPENFTPLFKVSRRDRVLWCYRWRMTDFFGRANHNIYRIYYVHWGKARQPSLAAAFKGKRQELFARNPRSYGKDPRLTQAYGDKKVPPHPCFSNPDTIKFFADEVITYLHGGKVAGGWPYRLRTYKGRPFYYPIQESDVPRGYCQCKECRKQFPSALSGNLSNMKFQFVSNIAKLAAKHDIRAGVSTLAYTKTYAYPEHVQLADNLAITLCPLIFTWWHPIVRERQEKVYREWIRKEVRKRPISIWTYIYSGGAWDARYHYGNYKPFPNLWPWKAAEIIKEFTHDGIRGFFAENDITYCGLEGYIAAKIAYNPAVNTDKLIDEYFDRYYGAAGPELKEFYRRLEKHYWDMANYEKYLKSPGNAHGIASPKGIRHNYWTTGLCDMETNWGRVTQKEMDELKSLLIKAAKKVKTPEEKKRLARITDGMWKTACKGWREYRLYKENLKSPLPVLKLLQCSGAPDWSKCPINSSWKNLNGFKSDSKCTVLAAYDSQNFYFKLTDPNGKAKTIPASPYQDDFELFLTPGVKGPVLQLICFPAGKTECFLYSEKDGVLVQKAFGGKIITESRIEKDGTWTVFFTIPIGIVKNPKRINFMRSRPGSGSSVWSPIFTGSYIKGIDNAGFLGLPILIEESAFSGTRIKDSAAANGQAVAMNANSGWTVNHRFKARPGIYMVTAWVRSDNYGLVGLKHSLGVYDAKLRKTLWVKTVKIDKIAGGRYQEIKLGEHFLKPGQMFFIGGVRYKKPLDTKLNGKRIYLDKLTLIPQ